MKGILFFLFLITTVISNGQEKNIMHRSIFTGTEDANMGRFSYEADLSCKTYLPGMGDIRVQFSITKFDIISFTYKGVDASTIEGVVFPITVSKHQLNINYKIVYESKGSMGYESFYGIIRGVRHGALDFVDLSKDEVQKVKSHFHINDESAFYNLNFYVSSAYFKCSYFDELSIIANKIDKKLRLDKNVDAFINRYGGVDFSSKPESYNSNVLSKATNLLSQTSDVRLNDIINSINEALANMEEKDADSEDDEEETGSEEDDKDDFWKGEDEEEVNEEISGFIVDDKNENQGSSDGFWEEINTTDSDANNSQTDEDFWDGDRLEVDVSKPQSNSSFDKNVIDFSASFNIHSDAFEGYLQYNGVNQRVVPTNGSFNGKIVLKSGQNDITFLIKSGSSIIYTKRISVTYTGRPVKLRATLTWDGYADIDLYLKDANGSTCNYQNKRTSLANLDVDNTNAYGPENISIESVIPGDYEIYIKNYSNTDGINASVYLYVNEHLESVTKHRFQSGNKHFSIKTISF